MNGGMQPALVHGFQTSGMELACPPMTRTDPSLKATMEGLNRGDPCPTREVPALVAGSERSAGPRLGPLGPFLPPKTKICWLASPAAAWKPLATLIGATTVQVLAAGS